MAKLTSTIAAAAAIALTCSGSVAQTLEAGFDHPASEFYPGGGLGISANADAVRAQLEQQKQAGLRYLTVGSGGAPGAYLSEPWKKAIESTLDASQAMGFDVTLMTSPGFSHTGDSRVQPHEAMKKLVWTETTIEGGRAFEGTLAAPPNNSGPFQNIPYFNESPWTIAMDKEFYRDIGVFAYRVSDEAEVSEPPTVTSSEGAIDAARLTANDPHHPILLDSDEGQPWLQLDYSSPQTVRSAVLATPETLFEGSVLAELSAQLDDGAYRSVAIFNMRSSAQVTVSFPAVRSQSFRVVFSRLPQSVEPLVPKGGADIAEGGGGNLPFGPKRPATHFAVSALTLHAEGRVNEFERKAGFFTFVNDYYALATDPASVNAVTRKADVIELTNRVEPDGSLRWQPPAGKWRVLRVGYSLTGKINHPAPPDATGLEVDKLSATHMSKYLNRYLDGLLPTGDARKAVTSLFADSIEAGPQTWTDDMFTEFNRRRGYDMRPFVPALTGVVVESASATDKFLWDYRQTIADLIHENTFGKLTEIAHARGLKTRVQALEQARHQLGDDFEMRRYADVPMGALWASADPVVDYLKSYPNQVADQRGAASVAHLYGRPVVAAESGTTLSFPGAFSPRVLKPIVDLEFAVGVNWLGRGAPSPRDLWVDYGAEWLRYLARTSYMLQQGRSVADVAYFYGQDAPLVTLRERLNDAPLEHGYDYINTEALLNLVSVRDGKLVAPSGMEYRVLQLGGSSHMMTLKVLRRLQELVRSGLVVAGKAPVDTPSLADDAAEFARIRQLLWGSDGRGVKLGKGRVYGHGPIAEVLTAEGVAPDLSSEPGKVGDTVLFQHRTLADAEVYFVTHRSESAATAEISFRQTGRTPELWRADTGERTRVSYRIENNRTIVPIDWRPNDAVFVVFRQVTQDDSFTLQRRPAEQIERLDHDWTLTLHDAANISRPTTAEVGSWSDSADSRVRFFSGTATYSRTISVAADALSDGARWILDLGEVQDIADVRVNDLDVGVRWTPPYEFDITSALKPGTNELAIKVTNRHVNSLIGAARSGAPPQPFGGYKPDAPLRPSGLIGPVALLRQ